MLSRKYNPTLKKTVWDVHIGPGVREAICHLCGIYKINNNINSGFECAHIVAHKFMTEEPNVYYLYPSCTSCNNECRDDCLFDFLYMRQRTEQLRKVIVTICTRYIIEHDNELDDGSRMFHIILDHLYGPKRFSAGGCIGNRKVIYEVAQQEQYQILRLRAVALAEQSEAIARQMRMLMNDKIKPLYLQ